MSQTGYTPIQLYYSTTAATAPTAGNLESGELAINITDGKLFYKNNAGVVQTLATKATALSTVTNNGVVYVNSSGQATSGSALTFDGATLTNGGNIVALGGDFSGSGASGYVQLRAGSTDTNTLIIRGASAGARFEFDINGSEQMRLTSTGLGIGTSSPSVKLDVVGTAKFSGGAGYVSYGDNGYIRTDIANKLAFQVGTSGATWRTSGNSGDLMLLDNSGNLGLGVTPSAWYSSYGTKAFQFAASGVLAGLDVSSSDRRVYLMNNAFINSSGNQTYINAGAATQYQQNAGQHQWFTAPSGTAGNAITFTQAMTLDASGNLLVGSTTQISAERLGVTFAAGNKGIALNVASGAAQTQILFANPNGAVGSITTTGAVTAYNVTSDQRLKENIVNAPEFGDVIDSIQVRSFDWKSDQTHQRAGFIAQELVTVAPEAVHQPADPDEIMAVDYSKLVPMLVKEIQSLRKRLATLESK